MYKSYKTHCTKLQETRRCRKLPGLISNQSSGFIDFSNNDYLALSKSKELLEAAKIAGDKYGVGSAGSRLLSGNSEIFEDFERKIAKDKNTETALIMNSGFQANMTILAALLDKSVLGNNPIVFFDRLNHSSLYQAIFLSEVELVRYRHNDIIHLADLLSQFANDRRPKFIVTETVFGMDGDVVQLKEIITLAKKYDTFLYLDEAHATGIFGKHGYGLSTNCNFEGIPHLIMGTFSKALGCFGAYIACSDILKEYLVNKATGFIYSTALSPIIIGAASKAWDLIPSFRDKCNKLFSKAHDLRNDLQKLGFDTGLSSTHIIPVILGEEGDVMHAKEKLLKEKIIVSAVRPPSVPQGSSCLRIALNIAHSKSGIARLIDGLSRL